MWGIEGGSTYIIQQWMMRKACNPEDLKFRRRAQSYSAREWWLWKTSDDLDGWVLYFADEYREDSVHDVRILWVLLWSLSAQGAFFKQPANLRASELSCDVPQGWTLETHQYFPTAIRTAFQRASYPRTRWEISPVHWLIAGTMSNWNLATKHSHMWVVNVNKCTWKMSFFFCLRYSITDFIQSYNCKLDEFCE